LRLFLRPSAFQEAFLEAVIIHVARQAVRIIDAYDRGYKTHFRYSDLVIPQLYTKVDIYRPNSDWVRNRPRNDAGNNTIFSLPPILFHFVQFTIKRTRGRSDIIQNVGHNFWLISVGYSLLCIQH
jgi:hypothetical protein